MMAVTWDVLRYDTVDSTNNVCKALAAQGLDSTAVIARAQTAGKGRLGRSFQSPEGGLYLSVLWRNCLAEQLLTVTPLASLSRGLVGITHRGPGGVLIVNAPGSRGGVKDSLTVVCPLFPHIFEQLDDQ